MPLGDRHTLRERATYVRRTWPRWLWDARPAWLLLVALAITVLWSAYGLGELGARVRWAGFGLELAGLVIVVNALREKSELFQVRGPLAAARAWVGAYPGTRPPPPVHGSMNAVTGAFVTAYGHSYSWPGADSPTQQRLDALERNLKDVIKRCETIEATHAKDVTSMREEIGAERNARERSVEELNRRLHATAVGGVPWEWVGVVLLAVGMLLSTVSNDL